MKDMFTRGGLRPFFVGSIATIQRDLVFGGTFSFCRYELFNRFHPLEKNNRTTNVHDTKINKNNDLVVNALSASIATILSSPFNYVRNMHYATPPDIRPLSAKKIMVELFQQASQERTVFLKARHIQKRLRLGWGTARVGLGMAFAAKMYSVCSQNSTSATS
jgi:hypothetical protein